MGDDAAQASVAAKVLTEAALIAVSVPCLCEFVWVLKRLYRVESFEVARAIRALLAATNVQTNRPAIEAGLSVLDAGGDFADGVIAYEGRWLGGDTFVSFDKQAVKLISEQGHKAQFLS